MITLPNISSALEVIKQLRTAYDKLNNLKKDLDSVEGQRLMLELDKEILSLEKSLHELNRENHELKKQLDKIQENQKMGFDKHFGTTTKISADGQIEHFCTSCLATKNSLVQMPLKEYFGGPGYVCPSCEKSYL